MNTYPGFYRAKNGFTRLYCNKSKYSNIDLGDFEWKEDININEHKSDTNITREYLANTYGEVKSKEHTEFIVKLAEGAGFEVERFGLVDHSWFSFMSKTLAFYKNEQAACSDNENLITIPLPPKEPEPKEWPQVGDSAIYNGLPHKVVVSTPDSAGGLVLEYQGEYCFAQLSRVSKPLTPEEELAKELEKMVYDGMDNSYDLNHNCYCLVSGLMKKYDIKKKPR